MSGNVGGTAGRALEMPLLPMFEERKVPMRDWPSSWVGPIYDEHWRLSKSITRTSRDGPKPIKIDGPWHLGYIHLETTSIIRIGWGKFVYGPEFISAVTLFKYADAPSDLPDNCPRIVKSIYKKEVMLRVRQSQSYPLEMMGDVRDAVSKYNSTLGSQ